MKKLLFRLWQWTWGLPQTLMGAMLWLLHRNKPHVSFHGCQVTLWPHGGSVSLGMFLFVHSPDGKTADPRLLAHEYGHSVQSLVLGPAFLLLVGLPSFLWASLPVCRRFRQKRRFSYYRLYTEAWANAWGGRVLGQDTPK